MYSGETLKSIDETLSWLKKLQSYIKGVSVGPVIIYGFEHEVAPYIRELKLYGSRAVDSGIRGVTYLDLSNEIDYEKSIDISKEISREFMKAKDFFYLKSFSYFSRDYSYYDFL